MRLHAPRCSVRETSTFFGSGAPSSREGAGYLAGVMPAVTWDKAVFGKEKYWPILLDNPRRFCGPLGDHGITTGCVKVATI